MTPPLQASAHWLQRARRVVTERFGQAVAARGGMLAVCVGPGQTSVGFAEHGVRRSLVVGRHSECQLRTQESFADVPLRQVLLWSEGTPETPRTRLMDLRGQLTTYLVGFGPIASAYLEGPVALWLGHTHLFVAHVEPGQRFEDALPAQLPAVEHANAALRQ